MFNRSPIHYARKSSNHKLSKNHKISPDTNLQKTYTNIKHTIFEEVVPSVLPLVKKKKKGTQTHTQGLDTLVSWAIPSNYQHQVKKKKKSIACKGDDDDDDDDNDCKFACRAPGTRVQIVVKAQYRCQRDTNNTMG